MVKKLVEFLEKCSDAYYNSDQVLVNDDTYDAMVETLRKLSPEHPYLQKVGSAPRKNTNKVGRVVPMGTLSKYHTEESVEEWLSSEGDRMVLLSPKYDGFGVELTYQDGYLVMASTRGNGYVGEDITSAMMKVHNVPVRLPEHCVGLTRVRGEAIVPRKNHDALKGLGYSAMRNAVPGIVRSDRSDALMYVDFIAYEFFDEGLSRIDQRTKYSDVFTVEEWTPFASFDFARILERRNSFGSMKDTYAYEIDGVVLKTDRIREDDLLNPKHQVAWKFKSNRRTTILRDIEFNVGATGAISVVGIFDPVEFQGATLKRASFGSLSLYHEMRPAIGDIVEVSRRGDIIPWIECIAMKNSDDYIELKNCPCCGTPLKEGMCPNKECPDRVKLKLYQYIKGVGVKGLGYSLLVALVDAGMIKTLVDIYTINAEDVATLPRQGKSSVTKWSELQSKKLTHLDFLCSYPIENSGKSLWNSLLSRYSLREIINLSEEELSNAQIKGIGSSKISSIVSQLAESREEILSLIDILDI